MKSKIWGMVGLLLLVMTAVTAVFAQSGVPLLDVPVTDRVGRVVNPRNIEAKIKETREDNGVSIWVLLNSDTAGFSDPDQFGQEVFAQSGFGDNDVIVIVTFDPRSIVLTNSTNLDGKFDALSVNCRQDWADYIIDQMKPYLQAGEFDAAILSAVENINLAIRGDGCTPVVERRTDPSSPAPIERTTSSPDTRGVDWGAVFLILVVLVVLVIFALILYSAWNSTPVGTYVGTYDDDDDDGGSYTPSYNWGGGSTYEPTSSTWSTPSRSSSRSSSWSSPSSSSPSRSSFGGGSSSSRSSFGGGSSSSRSSFSSRSSSKKSSSSSSGW